MELLINGTEHLWDKELEMFNEDYGFDITIGYKPTKQSKGYVVTYHNVEEFHHLYNKKSLMEFSDRGQRIESNTAFECPYHSHGFSESVFRLEYIHIVDAKSYHPKKRTLH